MSQRYSKEEQACSRKGIAKALESAMRDSMGRPIIYTVLRSVSKSGMSRVISIYVVDRAVGRIKNLSWYYERSYGRQAHDKHGGVWAVKVGGVGMDMGFHLASSLFGIAKQEGLVAEDFRHEWL